MLAKFLTSPKKHLTISVDNCSVDVTRKNIKNLRLKVLPPNGEVKLSVPFFADDSTVKAFISSRIGWIKQQQENIKAQTAKSRYEYIDGESIFYLGKSYNLNIAIGSKASVNIDCEDTMLMQVRKGACFEKREQLLNEWYRTQLKRLIPELLEKWQPIIGKQVTDWGVKKMKTRWGSCNVTAKRVWLNLELAKKPLGCLEMVIVHELVHLHEHNHSKKFYALMDKYMPEWKKYDDLLNHDDYKDNMAV